ncbi:MAG: hypothetical protein M1821_001522 [Bathelium mastoideum]|nr:MAG: hypothetical protein M1821_001522 [Bathelium mastoideum]
MLFVNSFASSPRRYLMAEITFFDLASRPKNSCWSLNPWKTRLQLNYKGVKYNTEWLEYPDLAPRLKSLGLDPNAAGVSAASYTSPSVLFHDDSKAFMDSKSIATEIEKRYPSPVLPVKTPMQERLEKVFLDVQDTLRPELVPRVPKNLLNPRSKEYFERTRAERLQMSLDEFERRGGGQQAWEKASEGLKKIAGLLQENEGPFFDGEQGENPSREARCSESAECVFINFRPYVD